MSFSLNDITIITVNYRTPDLIEECIKSFRSFYPQVKYLTIDNGGCQQSLEFLRGMKNSGDIQLVENSYNKYHGPTLHQGLFLTSTQYAFLLDSDTRTEKDGFLENMLEKFKKDSNLFALGNLIIVNDNGVKANEGTPYIHPFACLLDVEKYHTLSSFRQSGAPAIATMKSVQRSDYNVEHYPIYDYVYHKIAGTRGHFGGKWKPKYGQEKKEWTKFNL